MSKHLLSGALMLAAGIICLLSALSVNKTNAQSTGSGEARSDSLRKVLDLIAETKPAEYVIAFTDSLIKNPETDASTRILALKARGIAYQARSQWARSELSYQAAMQELDSLSADSATVELEKANILLQIAKLHITFSSELGIAMSQLFKAIRIAEKYQDTVLIISSARLIGYINRMLGDYSVSEKYIDQSIRLARLRQDTIQLIYSINEKANLILLGTGNNDEVLSLLNQAGEYAAHTSDFYIQACLQNDIGNVYLYREDYFNAIAYFNEAFDRFIRQQKYREACVVTINISSCYKGLNDFQNALNYYLSGLDLAEKYNIRHEKLDIYLNLANLYSVRKDFSNAFYYQSKYIDLKDSVFNADKEKYIAEIKAGYENEKKEKENEMLRQQNTINSLKIQKEKSKFNNLAITGIVVILSVLAILLTVIRGSRHKNKINRMLGEKNREVSEQKDRLAEAIATRDRFFSIIAHDLKNPFTSILGFTALLNEGFEGLTRQEQKEFIHNLNESSKNLYNLLENLLQWARSQTGQIKPFPEIIDVAEISASAGSVFVNVARAKNISFNYLIDEKAWVYADRGMLEMILRNLFSNAIKFTPEGGKVEISNRMENEQLSITVSDTGKGIDSADLSNLFKPGSGIQNKGTAGEPGTGLGLLVCHEFITLNNGSIEAESVPGSGSRFTIKLPTANNDSVLS